MTEPWKDRNYWIPESYLKERFWFQSWTDFLNQSPSESEVWKSRGFCLLSWSILKRYDIQTLQIVFLVNRPLFEFMYFEIPVKDSEEPAVVEWLRERIPPFWKNLSPS
jgi:hypothetical protein